MSGEAVGKRTARWGVRVRPLAVAVTVVTALAGCAAEGLSRAEVDAQVYADCVRNGGVWYGDNQFGGSCQYRGPSR